MSHFFLFTSLKHSFPGNGFRPCSARYFNIYIYVYHEDCYLVKKIHKVYVVCMKSYAQNRLTRKYDEK